MREMKRLKTWRAQTMMMLVAFNRGRRTEANINRRRTSAGAQKGEPQQNKKIIIMGDYLFWMRRGR